MKYIKKYENLSQEFDLNFAIAKIEENFSEDKVCEMFDEEVLEWVDKDWEDDYESEYDWYVDHNNGEAQDTIIYGMTTWYESNYHKLIGDQKSQLIALIKERYNCLNY